MLHESESLSIRTAETLHKAIATRLPGCFYEMGRLDLYAFLLLWSLTVGLGKEKTVSSVRSLQATFLSRYIIGLENRRVIPGMQNGSHRFPSFNDSTRDLIIQIELTVEDTGFCCLSHDSLSRVVHHDDSRKYFSFNLAPCYLFHQVYP